MFHAWLDHAGKVTSNTESMQLTILNKTLFPFLHSGCGSIRAHDDNACTTLAELDIQLIQSVHFSFG